MTEDQRNEAQPEAVTDEQATALEALRQAILRKNEERKNEALSYDRGGGEGFFGSDADEPKGDRDYLHGEDWRSFSDDLAKAIDPRLAWQSDVGDDTRISITEAWFNGDLQCEPGETCCTAWPRYRGRWFNGDLQCEPGETPEEVVQTYLHIPTTTGLPSRIVIGKELAGMLKKVSVENGEDFPDYLEASHCPAGASRPPASP